MQSQLATRFQHPPLLDGSPLVQKKTPLEIERFNREPLKRTPTGESLRQFDRLRTQIAPDRTDVTSWPGLLDLDEGRPVPKRTVGGN